MSTDVCERDVTLRSVPAMRAIRTELNRLLTLLGAHLARQRKRGRSPAADIARGLVIEQGEAEGLLLSLAADWRSERATPIADAFRPSPAEGTALAHAVSAFDLDRVEYDALMLALAVEADGRFGRLVALLNDHAARTRPTAALACALSPGAPDGKMLSLCERPLLRDGLLELEGDGPLPDRELSLAPDVLRRLVGQRGLPPEPCEARLWRADVGLLDRLVIPDALRERLLAWRDETPLLLTGPSGSGRSTCARAAFGRAGLDTVEITVDGSDLEGRLRAARREQRWYDAGLVLRVELDDGGTPAQWRAIWRQLEHLTRGVALVVSPVAVATATRAATRVPIVTTVDEPDVDARSRLWRRLLGPGIDVDQAALDDLAARFSFCPARIAQVAGRAAVDVSAEPLPARLLRFCREVGTSLVSGLAQKLPQPYSRDDLVAPPAIFAELDLAVSWIRNRRVVLGDWGFARRLPMGHGLTALFAGPPGTGKTMAAQVLARELDVDLYRVDLSRVMSKYIGETEKNLARLFDEAHASGAMLFFDEADALFGKRSEVKDAHDRYANVEIGYLLQRMEEHDGMTVLATNRARDLDEAFVRRFHIMIDFPVPKEEERLRLWQGMFPVSAERAADLDLLRLSREYVISGGEIRNAVLAAAFLAAAESRPIEQSHLLRALRRELIKGGRIVPEAALHP